MARKIQSQSGRSGAGIKTFVGLLANAIFWLVMAVVLPIRAFVEMIPELGPYAHWAPIIFYALALLSFVRAVRSLQRMAAGRPTPSIGPKAAGSSQAQRPAHAKPAPFKSSGSTSGLPITRTPTIQRMR
ncbi:MAG TPA: hypothetical protein VFE34_24405 [Dongiaceae bacterium]|jgi:hypothetical protein|nr:hypothetical protein [Dongiaceae bacterium]